MSVLIEVSSYLDTEMIIVVDAISKKQAFDLLIESIVKSDKINNPEEFKSNVLIREKQYTTAIGNGIAIPHARLSSISNFVIGLLICKNGIDYEIEGSEPINFLVMIAAPDKQDKDYIILLSKIVEKFKNKKFLNYLLTLENVNDIFRIIKNEDQ